MNSRNVPTLLSRNLTTPLSVNVDNNQLVPQRANANNVISLPDHLSPDTRKHLIGPFTGDTGGGGTTPIVSPTTSTIAAFDGFDYDESAAGLLQVGPDLLGSLLDRNLVWFSLLVWSKITRQDVIVRLIGKIRSRILPTFISQKVSELFFLSFFYIAIYT